MQPPRTPTTPEGRRCRSCVPHHHHLPGIPHRVADGTRLGCLAARAQRWQLEGGTSEGAATRREHVRLVRCNLSALGASRHAGQTRRQRQDVEPGNALPALPRRGRESAAPSRQPEHGHVHFARMVSDVVEPDTPFFLQRQLDLPRIASVPRFEMRGSPVLTPSVSPVVQRLLEPGCTSRGTVCLPQTGGLPAPRLLIRACSVSQRSHAYTGTLRAVQERLAALADG